jgi:hypothetical protein
MFFLGKENSMAKTKNDKNTSDKPVTVTKSSPEPGHLQITVSGPAEHVMAALTNMNFKQQTVAAAGPQLTVDDVLHQWLNGNPVGLPVPNQDQLQVAWKDYGSGGAYTLQVQQNLAGILNRAFFPGTNFVTPADVGATLPVGQLKLNLRLP